ncbi:MAG: thiamine pyrophosphate-dependent enzyme, partial [Bilophila wadsworthia]
LTDAPQLVNRPPSLCAGCPHRMSYYGVKLGCEGRDVIFATDIGCYSLGFMPPLRMADIGVCMGAAASMPAGLELAVGAEQRIVGFIGDSTLFHSGLTGIANAVYNHHRFVLVVLDNMVTAMTGHSLHRAATRPCRRQARLR